MPDFTTIALVCGAWLSLVVLACALCIAAGRSDEAQAALDAEDRFARTDAGGGPPVTPVAARPPAFVADTGALRARLRAGARLLQAERLTVTTDADGRETTLATSRPVLEAGEGLRPRATAAILVAGWPVARLRAVRRPGDPPFDAADRELLAALAARLAESFEAAPAAKGATPPGSPLAMV